MIRNDYKSITISPFEITLVEELRVHQKINEHATLRLTGTIRDELKDTYVTDTKSGKQIKVTLRIGEEDVILFTGMVQNISVKHCKTVYRMEIIAISNTYQMDIKLKNRSFQDINMPYQKLLKGISKEYSGGDMIDTKTEGKVLGSYILQYQESDWEFIKRMASRFNTILIPSVISSSPKYFFGIPIQTAAENLEDYNYNITKKLGDYLVESQNTNSGLKDLDRVYFELVSDKKLDLGSIVKYKDVTLYVCESNAEMKKSVLTYTYVLLTKRGMSQSTYHNNKTTGLSIKGRVLKRIEDRVKVHMEIDASQPVGTAFEFPFTTSYTAEGHAGWYCMPEVGDTVYIYHPNSQEANAVAFNSARASLTNKTDDPTVKYFRTADGKELKFSPEEILITAKDDEIYIRLNEKTGIEIYSVLPINIITEDDMNISSDKKIKMEASDEIQLSCRASKILMKPNVIEIKGKEIKNN